MKYTLILFPIKKVPQPVHWTCDGGTEYDMQEGNKTYSWYRDHTVL